MTETDGRRDSEPAGPSPPELLRDVAAALRCQGPIPEPAREWLLDGVVRCMSGDASLEEALGLTPAELQDFRRRQRDKWLRRAAVFVEGEHQAVTVDTAIKRLERRPARRAPPSNTLLFMLWRATEYGRLPGRRQLRRILEK